MTWKTVDPMYPQLWMSHLPSDPHYNRVDVNESLGTSSVRLGDIKHTTTCKMVVCLTAKTKGLMPSWNLLWRYCTRGKIHLKQSVYGFHVPSFIPLIEFVVGFDQGWDLKCGLSFKGHFYFLLCPLQMINFTWMKCTIIAMDLSAFWALHQSIHYITIINKFIESWQLSPQCVLEAVYVSPSWLTVGCGPLYDDLNIHNCLWMWFRARKFFVKTNIGRGSVNDLVFNFLK